MRSIVCVFFLLVLCITSAFGAASIGFYNDPRYPGKCTIKEDLILSPGQTVKDPSEDCARIICGDKGMAEFQSCGIGAIQGCKMGDYINKNLPYPDCCERHVICS